MGICSGVEIAKAIEGVVGVAATLGKIALKRLELARQVKDAVNAAALKTLVSSIINSIGEVSSRLDRVINVWDVVGFPPFWYLAG
jgi:hypothetical protein